MADTAWGTIDPLPEGATSIKLLGEATSNGSRENYLITPEEMKPQMALENVDNTSDENKPISLATQTAINNLTSSISAEASRAENAEEEILERLAVVEGIIPSAADTDNTLADKAYVDESIQTSTAVNRGAFETYADLVAYSGPVTRNDYATVGYDETHDNECWRYKWNDETEEWTAEYRINESPMTQAQLAALNSGITEDLARKIGDAGIVPITTAAYQALSEEEKMSDKLFLLTDAENGFIVVTDTVESGNMNAVSSNAVNKRFPKYAIENIKSADFFNNPTESGIFHYANSGLIAPFYYSEIIVILESDDYSQTEIAITSDGLVYHRHRNNGGVTNSSEWSNWKGIKISEDKTNSVALIGFDSILHKSVKLVNGNAIFEIDALITRAAHLTESVKIGSGFPKCAIPYFDVTINTADNLKIGEARAWINSLGDLWLYMWLTEKITNRSIRISGCYATEE